MATPTDSTIVLTGFMGAGKTTVGACLAQRLGLPFVDLDRTIEAAHGPIAAIFEAHGETAFRVIERDALAEQLALPPRVLATGGGAVLDPDSQTRLTDASRVWLRASWETIAARLVATGPDRPLWDASARARFAAREPVYLANADHVIDVDGLTPDAVTDAILESLESTCAS
ncbi:MAG: shikimate kinase [Myxococcota bacterium]